MLSPRQRSSRLPSLKQYVLDDEAEKAGENVYNYVDQIVRHSRLRIQDSIYAGANYVKLARYLSGPPYAWGKGKTPWNRGDKVLHGTIHTYKPEMFLKTTKNIFTPRHVSVDLQSTRDIDGMAHLIFLCGNPSPLALAGLAVACDLDPEFLRRHLSSILGKIDWLGYEASKIYQSLDLTLPSLPSTSHNILQLRYTSIGDSVSRGFRGSQRPIMPFGTSDSIIRESRYLGNGYVSIEQQISICVEYIPTRNNPRSSWLGKSSAFQSILEGRSC